MHRLFGRTSTLAASLKAYATTVKMPSLSPTMTEGTIVSWTVKEGEQIAPGDVICEIQTDKAVVSLEYDEEGVMAKILAAADSGDVAVGRPIAVVAELDEDWQSVEVPATTTTPSPPAQAVSSQPAVSAPVQGTHHRVVSPSARLLMMLYNVDASKVAAGGPKGALTKSDVVDFINVHKLTTTKQEAHSTSVTPTTMPTASSSAPSSTSLSLTSGDRYDDLVASGMRKTIAKRLTLSKQGVPHEYGTIDVGLEAALALRARSKADGTLFTLNDLLVKAVAMTLAAVPAVNVQYLPDDVIASQSSIDVSIAVATPSGLITPIVTDADRRSICDIGRTVRELAARAKDNKLRLDEFQGGTFTISNLGMMGIASFTGIINAPQCAILCVGATRPTMVGAPMTSVDKHVAHDVAQWSSVMSLTLCYDARAIDASTAAHFMSVLRAYLQTPETMLCGVSAVAENDEDNFDIASHALRITVMSTFYRSQVLLLYKTLYHLGREYPKGAAWFHPRLKSAFAKHAGERDADKIEALIARGQYVVKELEAMYSLRKYRAMKKRYYD